MPNFILKAYMGHLKNTTKHNADSLQKIEELIDNFIQHCKSKSRFEMLASRRVLQDSANATDFLESEIPKSKQRWAKKSLERFQTFIRRHKWSDLIVLRGKQLGQLSIIVIVLFIISLGITVVGLSASVLEGMAAAQSIFPLETPQAVLIVTPTVAIKSPTTTPSPTPTQLPPTPTPLPTQTKPVPTASPTTFPNLLINGDFEREIDRINLSDWRLRGEIEHDLESEEKASPCSIQTMSPEDDPFWSGFSQKISVVGGVTYELSSLVKWSNAVQVHVKIIWFDAGRHEIDVDFLMGPVDGNSLGWETITPSVIVPSNAAEAELFFWHGVKDNTNHLNSTFCIDDVVLTQQ